MVFSSATKLLVIVSAAEGKNDPLAPSLINDTQPGSLNSAAVVRRMLIEPGFFLGDVSSLASVKGNFIFSLFMNTFNFLMTLPMGTFWYNSKWNPIWYVNSFFINPKVFATLCKDKDGKYTSTVISGNPCSLFAITQVLQVLLWGLFRGIYGFGLFEDQGAFFAVLITYAMEGVWWLFQAVTGNFFAFELSVKGFTTFFIGTFFTYAIGSRGYWGVKTLAVAIKGNTEGAAFKCADIASGNVPVPVVADVPVSADVPVVADAGGNDYTYCVTVGPDEEPQMCQYKNFVSGACNLPAAKWSYGITIAYGLSLVFSGLTFVLVLVNGWFIQLFLVPAGMYNLIECKPFIKSFLNVFVGPPACQNNLRSIIILALLTSSFKSMAHFNSGYASAHFIVLAVVVVELIAFSFYALTTGQYFNSFTEKGNALQKAHMVSIVSVQVVLPLIQAGIAIFKIVEQRAQFLSTREAQMDVLA